MYCRPCDRGVANKRGILNFFSFPSQEVSKAKYIVEQYVAASGGERALSAATSMYAVGKVLMRTRSSSTTTKQGQKARRTGMVGVVHGGAEIAGGLVLWQKGPEVWCVEMVVAGGTKMSAGSDGRVAWRQTPWQQAHASRGPPRPLRRCVQVSIYLFYLFNTQCVRTTEGSH